MQSITDIEITIPKVVTKRNERSELLNELYDIYIEFVNHEYRIKNKKRYYSYLRLYRPEVLRKATTKQEYDQYKDEFRKAKLPEHQRYVCPIKKDDFLWWGRFSHLKGEDGKESIRHIISVARDMVHRKQDPIPYILGAGGKLSTDSKG